jgi:hypothetical protein
MNSYKVKSQPIWFSSTFCQLFVSQSRSVANKRNESLTEVNRVGQRVEAFQQQSRDSQVVIAKHCFGNLLWRAN